MKHKCPGLSQLPASTMGATKRTHTHTEPKPLENPHTAAFGTGDLLRIRAGDGGMQLLWQGLPGRLFTVHPVRHRRQRGLANRSPGHPCGGLEPRFCMRASGGPPRGLGARFRLLVGTRCKEVLSAPWLSSGALLCKSHAEHI